MLPIVSDTYKASSATVVGVFRRPRPSIPRMDASFTSVGEGCGVSRSLSAPALLLRRRGCEREHGCLRLLSALLGAIGASATTLAPCPSTTSSIVVYVHTALTRAFPLDLPERACGRRPLLVVPAIWRPRTPSSTWPGIHPMSASTTIGALCASSTGLRSPRGARPSCTVCSPPQRIMSSPSFLHPRTRRHARRPPLNEMCTPGVRRRSFPRRKCVCESIRSQLYSSGRTPPRMSRLDSGLLVVAALWQADAAVYAARSTSLPTSSPRT
ncbi:hypothetical protein C8R46DRAFT_427440 [Mycena filopes]|nr:hypothetical protein C8R46DRAFT_427440 [Mycena filopes]